MWGAVGYADDSSFLLLGGINPFSRCPVSLVSGRIPLGKGKHFELKAECEFFLWNSRSRQSSSWEFSVSGEVQPLFLASLREALSPCLVRSFGRLLPTLYGRVLLRLLGLYTW